MISLHHDLLRQVAEREHFGIVKTLVGHGIGEFFHGVPQIFHCRNSDNRPDRLAESGERERWNLAPLPSGTYGIYRGFKGDI